MPALRELQSAFASAMRNPDRTDPALNIAPSSLPAAAQLLIYRNNIGAALTRALEGLYPVVARLVGDDFFKATARAYIAAHPSRHANIMAYGRQFPEFVAGFTPAAALAYLPDVARLELGWNDAFHAADAPLITASALTGYTPERLAGLRLQAHPSLHLLRSPYPIGTIWHANQPGSAGNSVDLNAGAEHLIICRPELEVQLHAVEETFYQFVVHLAGGKTLAHAAEEAQARDAFDLESAIIRLFRLGLFSQIKETRP